MKPTTTPATEQARRYLDGFIREALARLSRGDAADACWEIGRCWKEALFGLRTDDGGVAFVVPADADWREGKLHGIPIRLAPGGRVRLVLRRIASPYDRPAGAADDLLTLDTIPMAIAYRGGGDVPRCVVVTARGIEDSPVAAILPRSPSLLPGGPTVAEAGRIFAGQYFRRDLEAALRNEGLSERAPATVVDAPGGP